MLKSIFLKNSMKNQNVNDTMPNNNARKSVATLCVQVCAIKLVESDKKNINTKMSVLNTLKL